MKSHVTHHVTLLPGEGIGPEVSAATQRILEAAGVTIEWDVINARLGDNPADAGKVLNQAALDSVRRTGVALKGPMTTAIACGARREFLGFHRMSTVMNAAFRPRGHYSIPSPSDLRIFDSSTPPWARAARL